MQANAPQKELRHRTNVFAEGVWFLLSNMIVLQGVSIALETRDSHAKSKNRQMNRLDRHTDEWASRRMTRWENA